jgi:hypothetical protein
VAPFSIFAGVFLGFIGTAADAGAFKHTRVKMSTISFRIYLPRFKRGKIVMAAMCAKKPIYKQYRRTAKPQRQHPPSGRVWGMNDTQADQRNAEIARLIEVGDGRVL